MSQPLLAPSFLFRFAAPCVHRDPVWEEGGIELGPEHKLPSFGELEGGPLFADLRAAWSREGLTFALEVVGKKQQPWCRPTRLEDSDGLSLFIDTRATHNVHRGTRFCHRFYVMPHGGGSDGSQPIAQMALLNRAREHPKPVGEGALPVVAQRRPGGYALAVHIPAKCLTGFDPEDHPRIGFTYAVVDKEKGWQTFSIGSEFPFQDDPSLWGDLELQGSP